MQTMPITNTHTHTQSFGFCGTYNF